LGCEDESSITDITILPDGRIYLFGASAAVLEMLCDIPLHDPALRRRMDHLGGAEAGPCPVAGDPNEACPSQGSAPAERPREDLTS
jgi:hypothetical protein